MKQARYLYSVWHGESKTLYYIIDTLRDEVVETLHSLAEAKEWVDYQNSLAEVSQ